VSRQTQNNIDMKKIILACAVVLAGVLTSCGDTNYCYQVTTTVSTVKEWKTTTYYWCTPNELEAIKADLKEAQTALGIDEKLITITATRTHKSSEDCR
jgi:hypothetical protein